MGATPVPPSGPAARGLLCGGAPLGCRRAQVDVIETQFAELEHRLEAAADFEAAERAHGAFLAACTQQSFLDLRVVGKAWEGILSVALSLVALALTDDGSAAAGAAEPRRVEALRAEFSRHCAALYLVLRSSKLQGSAHAPYLRQFLAGSCADFFSRIPGAPPGAEESNTSE